ncbi:MAG: DNA repair protein RecN [Clostridia bacterium]|nr:DNA repair protein RecN [Clostridia bacterium]
MLKYLSIENIAVIESTEIDFSDGFNVLTGETGAGKSIIIDSINAVLGERTSKELIRKGAEKASVSAVFSNLSSDAVSALESFGFFPDEDGNLLINRTFTATSGSVKINGKPATVGILKDIAGHLVNIHGQHDSQGLLNPDNHCGYIDRVAENGDEIEEYYAEFKNLNAIRRQLSSIKTSEEEKARKIDLLEYQIKELESANITVGEKAKLKEQLEIAESFEKTVNSVNNAHILLSGADETDGGITKINNAVRCISSIKSGEIKDITETLRRISAELETASDNLNEYLRSIKDGEFNKESIADRLDLINRLMRKYGNSEQEMLSFLENAKKELEAITLSGELEEKLSKELDNSTERLIELGEKLTKTRVAAAKTFSSEVTNVLKYLDMVNVEFDVKSEKGRYTKSGCDVIEFYVKTNVGEDFKPLSRIASGGELSRIMLAIKSVLAEKDDVDTLIFDEIDTGISGFAADKVGKQLSVVADTRQVICVTHLAQIACCGDNHLKIEKTAQNGRTYTKVNPLDYEDRIVEIARIMSGTEITENLYNSAKELLDRR